MTKTIRRLVGGLCIITALILTQIPAGKIVASNAKENFLMDHDILVEYTGTSTNVSVSDDVKIIGEEAFAGNSYIGVINIGKNVKEIRHGAFANCNYINRIVIPDSVTEIESAAFSGCESLKNVSLGANVESIGDGVFAACKNLGGISIPKKNDNFIFEAGVLYDKNKTHIYTYLTANPYEIYYMPNSVNRISPYSFWGNEDLEEAYLSSSLEEIPAYSFSNCRNLKIVQIPYSVDSIDAKAFENCISLENITIPASVRYIDPTAFDGCYKLNIIAEEGTPASEFAKTFEKTDVAVTESQDVKDVIKNLNHKESEHKNENSDSQTGNGGYIDASNDPSNVDWMPSVNPLIKSEDSSVLGKSIVVNGRAVLFVNREIDVYSIDRPVENVSLDTSEESDDINVVYDSGKGGYLPKYTYVDGKVASQAFYASSDSDDYIIPSGTKSIGDFAFARCKASEIVIPDGVETIGYGAFYHCDNLENVVIPGSVKKIEGYAFDNTPFYNRICADNSNGDFYIAGDGILLAYSGSSSQVNIPSGVKCISAGCFENNQNVNEVYLPESLVEIDSDAFRNCSNLVSVVGGDNVEVINDRAFMGCPIGGYEIKDSVKYIGLRSFDFSNTNLNDNEKVISFEGQDLPAVVYDKASSRLSNYDYRQDALYNAIFAVVDNDSVVIDNTVLDRDTLGFSGVIVTKEKDESGNETGNMLVVINNIFSNDVLNGIPHSLVLNNKEYQIIGIEETNLATNPYQAVSATKTVTVNDNSYSASLSEKESVGELNICRSENAKISLNAAYSILFGGESIDNLESYEIKLKDSKNVVDINKLGKTSLYITVPVEMTGAKYHVITLDEDNQLEELPLSYNSDNGTVTFETSHLSYFGIYATDADNVVLNIKDGKLVKNYRLDASPDTGDKSISVYYVISLALVCLGLLLILVKGKKRL